MRNFRVLTSIGMLLILALSLTGIAAAQDEATARPWIGVSISDSDEGIVVLDIAPDSPAASSDLAVDDVIVTLNGDDVTSSSELIEMLQAFAPEDTVTLGIERGEDSVEIEITLGEFPEELQVVPGRRGERDNIEIFGRASVLPMLGVVFDEVDEGWQITRVLPIPGAESFQEGDIITEINGESVQEADFMSLIESLMQDGASIEVTLLRDGEEMTVEIEALDVVQSFGRGDFGPTGEPRAAGCAIPRPE